ncbi:TolC family protein [bacterium]|nr:TolC family protein [bacterium]
MKWLFTPFLLILLGTSAVAQRELSLAEAQALALEHYQDVHLAELAVQRAEQGVDAVRARRLPRLDFEAGYTHVSETASIDFQIPGVLSRSISFGDGNVYETALTASVPLFSGFRLSAMQDAAETRSSIAREALQGTRTALRHRVALLYRRAQLARRSVHIYDEQLQWLGKQLETLKQLYAQGQVLAYDTLQLSTRRSALDLQRSSALVEERNTLLTLGELLVQSAGSFSISEEITYDEAPLQEYRAGKLGDMALEKRSDFRILSLQEKLYRDVVRSEEADYYPSLQAFASYRYGRPGVDQISNEWMDYYTAGVKLQWNLWSWGGDRAEVAQQQIALKETESKRSRLRGRILTGIDRIVNELDVLQATRSVLERQVEENATKQQLVRARFTQGLATATELVDAETATTTARLQREQNEIRYAMKLTELAVETGWN